MTLADWDVPRWNAKPPLGVTKQMLCCWLFVQHKLWVGDRPGIAEIVAAVEAHYPGTIANTGGGPHPATWDIWTYVVQHEQRLRGGQRSLFLLEDTDEPR